MNFILFLLIHKVIPFAIADEILHYLKLSFGNYLSYIMLEHKTIGTQIAKYWRFLISWTIVSPVFDSQPSDYA